MAGKNFILELKVRYIFQSSLFLILCKTVIPLYALDFNFVGVAYIYLIFLIFGQIVYLKKNKAT